VAGDDATEILDGPPGVSAGPITSFSVEEAAENGTFRWAPVLIEHSPRPTALYLMWRSFQFVVDQLDDPRLFPPLPSAPTDEEMTVFRRYIARPRSWPGPSSSAPKTR
jgi:hypothetical protein